MKQELEKLGIETRQVNMGEIETAEPLSKDKLAELESRLAALGFEVLDDSRQQLIEKIKNILIEQVHYTEEERKRNYSEILTQRLHKDYSNLSNLFSAVEGITIEKYIINQKIEKAKELIIYDEMNLSEIAFKLGYSSVAHLSNQFKKVTGLTPTHFKKLGRHKRTPLDQV